MEERRTLRFVVFEEEGWLVAQCLEFDLATQAKELEDLFYEVERLLVGQVVACRETGREPFKNLPTPPTQFEGLWNEARLEVRPLKRGHQVRTPEFSLRKAARSVRDPAESLPIGLTTK